jgi:CRISPR-associated protein Csx16
MTTYFITRHQGAVQWAEQQGFKIDHVLPHFDSKQTQQGDKILGTLPVHLAAEVCAKGGQYFHLIVDTPVQYRGKELTPQQMDQFGATLQAFSVAPLFACQDTEGV